jgi:hypothetical protein
MADFYPVLARAVSSLSPDDVRARRDLYARARTIVVEQLRSRGLQVAALEGIREQAALETAIGRIEAEVRTTRTKMNGAAAAPQPPVKRPAANGGPDRTKTTAASLARILEAVQSDAQHETAGSLAVHERKTTNGTKALVAIEESNFIDISANRAVPATEQLAGEPNSLGTMFLVTAYAMVAIAFASLTYIRCRVWIAHGVIGYPTLLFVMAITFALFIVPPMMISRRASPLPRFGFLLRFIYSASRRVS